MPNFTGSFGEVVTRGIRFLTSRTNIRQMAIGSKARALIEAFAKEVDNLSVLQDTNLKKAFLPTSFGQFLEHFGTTVGLTKYTARGAEALAADRAFRFYVRGGGTFGSINNSLGFVIPAGTRLTAPATVAYEASALYTSNDEPDTIYDRSIHYLTTADVTVTAAATEAYVSAKALSIGIDGNLAAPKMIKSHTFVDYDDYLGKSLLVENTKPVLNGIDNESESSYRYRISKEITAAEKANYTAIMNAARAVPGVADVVIMPWEDGVGRFNVYVKSISSVVSDNTISDVQAAIDATVAEGLIGYARKPYEIGVEIDSTITFKSDYKDDIKRQIRESLKIGTVKYLNSLSLGQSLSLSALQQELKAVDSRIAGIGFNKTTFFDGVFVWYPAKLADTSRRRERLIASSVMVPLHARIVAETSLSDPVRFV